MNKELLAKTNMNKELLAKTINEALQDYWNDFCHGTGCFPSTFTWDDDAKELDADFRDSSFGEWAADAVLRLLEAGDPAPRIPVDSIPLPGRYRKAMYEWHGGQSSMLYACASSNGLKRGNITHGYDTPEKHYLSLWFGLVGEITLCRMQAEESQDPDARADIAILKEMELWAVKIVAKLETSYGLADWEQDDD